MTIKHPIQQLRLAAITWLSNLIKTPRTWIRQIFIIAKGINLKMLIIKIRSTIQAWLCRSKPPWCSKQCQFHTDIGTQTLPSMDQLSIKVRPPLCKNNNKKSYLRGMAIFSRIRTKVCSILIKSHSWTSISTTSKTKTPRLLWTVIIWI